MSYTTPIAPLDFQIVKGPKPKGLKSHGAYVSDAHALGNAPSTMRIQFQTGTLDYVTKTEIINLLIEAGWWRP